MSEERDLHELLGDGVPEAELEQLRRVDDALRATPAPPEVPEALTAAVLSIPGTRSSFRGRRALAGLAVAACIAGAAFGIGFWVGGNPAESTIVERITLNATEHAPPEARMVIAVLAIDEAGNWPMAADVSGLPPLPAGAFYEVWLTRGEELAMSCGRFVVGKDGTAADVWLNAPYKLRGYERWVVTAQLPGKPPSEHILDGPVVVPA